MYQNIQHLEGRKESQLTKRTQSPKKVHSTKFKESTQPTPQKEADITRERHFKLVQTLAP